MLLKNIFFSLCRQKAWYIDIFMLFVIFFLTNFNKLKYIKYFFLLALVSKFPKLSSDYCNKFLSGVPVPKSVPIAVPHPIAVGVPQPYPVHVPVPKHIPIQVVKTVAVPVEKKIPYPVEKHIPIPVEKPVPITIEKHIPVPVIKPYPIKIPVYKTIYHHAKKH